MTSWDEDGVDEVGISLYYCVRCEDFFELSPIAPLRCPRCYCDPRYIIGPLPAKSVDINKLIDKQNKKYKGKLSR